MNVYRRIIRKYNSLKVQIKVVVLFTFVSFLQRGISIFTTPIFTRVLTNEEYGLFSVFSAWFYVLVIICTLNIHMGAINNALTKMPNEKERVISSFQSVSLIFACISLFFALLFLEKLSNLMNLPKIVVVFMFVGFVFYVPYNAWIIYKRYIYDYRIPVIISIIISLLTPIISIISVLLLKDNRGEARIISFIVASIVIPGALFYCVNYKNGRIFYDKKLWNYAISFNVPLIPHFLSEVILNRSDTIMIGSMKGAGDAGIYNIAYTSASLIQLFSTSLNMAFIPWQYQKLEAKDYPKLAKVSYTVLSSVGGLLICLILFSPELIYILAGDSYMGAISLVPILGMSVFFNYMYQIFTRVELYYEKKKYTVIATLVASLINILLNYLWIPQMGYRGAGYSTLISHIFLCMMHYFFYIKVCKENKIVVPFYRGRIIVLISVIFFISSFVVAALYNCFLVRLAVLLVVFISIFIYRSKIKQKISSLYN